MDTMKIKILSMVSLHHGCNDASVVVLPTIFPILYTEGVLIRQYSDIGTIILIGLVFALLFQLLIGHHAKVYHYRRFLALDALLVGISLLLVTLSKNFMMLALCYMGVRIGTSIYHPVGIAWISQIFSGRNLDRAMGIQSAFGDVGVLVAFVSTGILTEHFGWKVPILLWGILNLAAVIIGLSISRGTTEKKSAQMESVSWRQTIRNLKPYMPLLLLGGLAWGVTINYAPSLLNHRLGISMSNTGIILAFWMGAGTLSALFYGRIAELLGRPRTLITAYTIIIASALTIAFSDRTSLTIAVFILYGFALFVTYPANLAFVGSTVDTRNRTAAFSLTSNIMIIGNSVFAFISGFISDAYGINTPFLLLAGAASLILLYLSISVKRGIIRAVGLSFEDQPKDIVQG